MTTQQVVQVDEMKRKEADSRHGRRDSDSSSPFSLSSGSQLKQWFLTWVRSNPRGSVSQSQGFGGDQETHLTHMIRDGMPCCPSFLQMIMQHHLANLCCRGICLQLDETTDVSNLSQLAVLVRYVKDNVINEDFLFCKPLTTTTKAARVKKPVDNFFKDNSLSWDMVSAVCSDSVPVTLGKKSCFSAVVKANAPHIIVTHCILHRHALATKTLPPKLVEVLKIVDYVNYMQISALRHRIFSELCKEMGSEFEVLLYHSNIRWLSRGQVLNRVFAVRVELALFLQEHQHFHADCLKNSEFILILVHLADIFAALNHLNHKMQGGGFNIIEAEENLKAFQKKLPLWKRRTENNNFADFRLLDDCVRSKMYLESETFLYPRN
ncbi:hypothetical protein FHG87_015941 [Trinorchestia longiramus]|nr:hypothetical protein FHG87_015941 [Trinorchestia longiramus]